MRIHPLGGIALAGSVVLVACGRVPTIEAAAVALGNAQPAVASASVRHDGALLVTTKLAGYTV